MKTTLLSSMGSFVLGTGATLVVLSTWLGTADLTQIKEAVLDYIVESEQHALGLVEDYNVMVDEANAEIGDYQVALEQANDNISQLITAYEEEQAQAEQDYAELQAEFEAMQTRLEEQYEADMNAIIEQANAQIEAANQEVAEAKEDVLANIESSQVDDIVNGSSVIYENVARHELATDGDKSVQDISGIVGEEQPAE